MKYPSSSPKTFDFSKVLMGLLMVCSVSVGLILVACMKVGDGIGVTENGSPRIDPCTAAPTATGCPQDPCVLTPTSKGCPQDPCVLNPQAEGCVVVVDSCSLPNPPKRCTTPPGPSFNLRIKSLLSQNCQTCHNTGSGTGFEQTQLSLAATVAYASLVNVEATQSANLGRSIKRVVPYYSDSSYLYMKITNPPYGVKMPMNGTLTQVQIDLIKAWIDGGAQP
jgi:hypothetical protein